MKPLDLLGNAVRAKEILAVMARHGFADLFATLDRRGGLIGRFAPDSGPRRSKWERIRLVAEELGPAWVKFGQLLSMRPDVIPHPLILELRKLQDAVPPVPFAEIREVLVEELEAEPEDVFSEFSPEPLASASLAQVYSARLRTTGEPVAVKVQRPNIARTVRADLELAEWLVRHLHNRENLRPFDLPSVLEAVRDGVERELDFRNEARNQGFFNSINPEPDQVFAPRVYNTFTTARVLVMERIEGTRADLAAVPADKARELAAYGAQSFVHQVLLAGFFHADPHAGNVFVTLDGRLCFLDWGLVGHLTRRLRYALADFWIAAVQGDAETIVRIAAELAPPGVRTDLRAMERDVTLALREELNFALGRQQIGRAMLRLIYVCGVNGIPLSRDYSLMAKGVLAIEEVGRMLDPTFDLRTHARPVLHQLARERTGPHAMLRRSREFLRSSLANLQDLPSELQRLIRRLEHDDFTINFQHRGLEEVDDAIKAAANRLTLGVVSGSLIIGSSLIVTTGIRPHLFGYPALGIVGYLLSALVGFYIIWDIFRRGGHR